jgi:hypothetical protein
METGEVERGGVCAAIQGVISWLSLHWGRRGSVVDIVNFGVRFCSALLFSFVQFHDVWGFASDFFDFFFLGFSWSLHTFTGFGMVSGFGFWVGFMIAHMVVVIGGWVGFGFCIFFSSFLFFLMSLL